MNSDSQDRILGELLEHKRSSIIKLDRLEIKIDSLLAFRWKLAGITSVAALIGGAVIEGMISALFKHGG